MKRRSLITLAAAATMAATGGLGVQPVFAQSKEIVYMTPALDVPFWRIVSKGVESVAKKEGYAFSALEAQNNAARQLKNAQDAIARGVAGIVISPTDSSTAPSVLKLAAEAKIPVVICDIGTNSGDHVRFIASVLAERLLSRRSRG